MTNFAFEIPESYLQALLEQLPKMISLVADCIEVSVIEPDAP